MKKHREDDKQDEGVADELENNAHHQEQFTAAYQFGWKMGFKMEDGIKMEDGKGKMEDGI